MKETSRSITIGLRSLIAATALVAVGAAQAAVAPPALSGFADYGRAGNIFELAPSLFVQGLGNADDPVAVVGLNADLSFADSSSGWGTGLVRLDYRVSNTGVGAFGPLRFMLFANPDGDGVAFLDTLSETWGVGGGGNPVRREAREFTTDPFSTITARFRSTSQLNEGLSALDAACTSAGGCDAVIGLQWDAPTLGPGETFHIVVGLSDNGQALSSRWIDATSSSDPTGTTLRLSGMSQIIPVPEPASAWMLAAGLALLGGAAARRRARR